MTPLAKLPLVGLTCLALIAFAANSILTRMALADPVIDASSFTLIRLLSGSVVLMLMLAIRQPKQPSPTKGSWLSSLMLFVYALGFSFAYLMLETGTGALILFGMVQITMVVASLMKGQRLAKQEWLGIGIAFAGLVYLVWPQVSTPSLSGVFLMSLAGVAWGVYTLRGRGSQSPLADTAYNFTRTLPFLLLLLVFSMGQLELSANGIMLAVLSGALASGLGYTLWYSVLTHLSATQAGVLQLLVPVIAALGGILFVSEPLNLRFIVASLLILGGIYLVIRTQTKTASQA